MAIIHSANISILSNVKGMYRFGTLYTNKKMSLIGCDVYKKDVMLACKKCPILAQVSSFCPFVRKSRVCMVLAAAD